MLTTEQFKKLSDPEANKRYFDELEKKHERVHKYILKTYFPKHMDHTLETIDVETMYGLLLVEYKKCSCGAILEFDRDMFVDLGEKPKENPV